jgi:hypothetical protein
MGRAEASLRLANAGSFVAPRVGLEPTTLRLTAEKTGVSSGRNPLVQAAEVIRDARRSAQVGRKFGRRFCPSLRSPRRMKGEPFEGSVGWSVRVAAPTSSSCPRGSTRRSAICPASTASFSSAKWSELRQPRLATPRSRRRRWRLHLPRLQEPGRLPPEDELRRMAEEQGHNPA